MAKFVSNSKQNGNFGTLLIDSANRTEYSELLQFICAAKSYFPRIKIKSLRDFIFYFILALARNKNIVLFDADLSAQELSEISVSNTDEKIALESACRFETARDVFEAVKKSTSKIDIYTSGTTGLPKKITHTMSTLARATRVSEKHSADVWGFAYNPTHMAGLQVLLQAILNGNEMVNLFRKGKEEIFDEINSRKITHISATPTFFRLLIPSNNVCKSVKRITCGGEKSDSILYSKLKTIFPNAKINNIYASTEFGTLLASNGEFFSIPEEFANFVKIENNELLVHKSLIGVSDTLVLNNDFYRTGDIVAFDGASSRFRFLARAGNILNVGGYKVNLEETENAFRSIDGVADVLVFGRTNSVLGNILCANVKLDDGANLSVADIRKRLGAILQPHKIPRKIEIVENLQLTRTGKIKR